MKMIESCDCDGDRIKIRDAESEKGEGLLVVRVLERISFCTAYLSLSAEKELRKVLNKRRKEQKAEKVKLCEGDHELPGGREGCFRLDFV